MCETASAVSSIKIRGGVSSFKFAAATAASLSEVSSFNVINSSNSALKNNNTNFKNLYNNSSTIQVHHNNFKTTKSFNCETQSIYSKPISTLLSKQNKTIAETKNKTSEIVDSYNIDFFNNKRSTNFPLSGVSTIINESDFPHLGVRWSPSLSGATTVDTLSSVPSSVNNIYGNNTVSMHGGFLASSTSLNNAQQQTSFQTNIFNRESGVQLNRPYANLIRDNISLNSVSNEFRIQNEDFPALPASQLSVQQNLKSGEVLINQEMNLPEHHDTHLSDVLNMRNTQQHTNTKPITEKSSLPMKIGIQTHSNGLVTNIPANMLNDQYGMAGLLTFLRTLENDPSIVALALGQDLTNLGLNLNSPKYRNNLHQTFGGPWSDYPPRMQDLDINVPSEYLTNLNIRDKLPNIKLNKFSDDVLFYLFYNCPGEVYQSAAAWELYQRDWEYHKLDRVWLTKSSFSNSMKQGVNFEKTSYHIFDPIQWRKIPKEMIIDFKEIEGRPYFPGATTAPNMPVPNVVPPSSNISSRNLMPGGHPMSQHNVFAAAVAAAQQQQQNTIHSIASQQSQQQQQQQQQLSSNQAINTNGTIRLENLMDQSAMQRK